MATATTLAAPAPAPAEAAALADMATIRWWVDGSIRRQPQPARVGPPRPAGIGWRCVIREQEAVGNWPIGLQVDNVQVELFAIANALSMTLQWLQAYRDEIDTVIINTDCGMALDDLIPVLNGAALWRGPLVERCVALIHQLENISDIKVEVRLVPRMDNTIADAQSTAAGNYSRDNYVPFPTLRE